MRKFALSVYHTLMVQC